MNPSLARAVEPRRPGERLREEQHVGIFVLDLADQPRPEVGRLGVRVVHPKHLDAVGDPEPHHPQHLFVQPRGVVVEVDRIDVLVLLRRVLGIGDGAVGQHREPLGMILAPTDGRVRTAGPGPAPPPCRDRAWRRRSRRSPRWCPAWDGLRRGRPCRCRSPTASPRHRAQRSPSCWGPCGGPCRSDGSAEGRRRRSPSRRCGEAPWWRWRTCRGPACPSCPTRRSTAETTRTTR